MRPKPLSYTSTGVSYAVLDTFKRLAQKASLKVAARGGVSEVGKSRGESAFVWEEKDCYRAFVIEGLGTKNLVADETRKVTGKTYYRAIAQDTVAAIINDLIVVGATPQVISAYFAVGNSEWFSDAKRTKDLVNGWADACDVSGVTWGGGETPALKGIIEPASIDLAGSAVGIVKPKNRLILGDTIAHGDAIILIESNGIHANGLSLARAIAQKIPHGYATKLSDGSLYGEALLTPTHIYAQLVRDIFASGVDIHYMVNITGHGWRKLMRARGEFSYIINTVPDPQPVFRFMREQSGNTDYDMYGTFNMGAGFALYIPERDVKRTQKIIGEHKLKSWFAGVIHKGTKRVVIGPKRITYASDTLQVR
ncbi:phosphoribosylformylglycinamidine cyclo-ligase [Candidatus Gottesmanbacteria bacterium RIFCSPLOWO2_01_FULL_46_9]|uniref:Phosphoribosylformylglycinamidine cyclo-ligase n=1 Tax=Candidatus Gottesmanbacteria bacterium RIFCSPLOWO2_01_FULL_46_9 TaxID=1798394 RepID=A0A1F6B3W6_9BACT|nr:MAG: phosphoribosylformylglycinamidine cyclo-ligase [Candidatus Gottesmanbacteria bacterium RIFCSPLOWO2_01_FULL_46_9]